MLFGLTEAEAAEIVDRGCHPFSYYETNLSLRRALDPVASGALSAGDPAAFDPFVFKLLYEDLFLIRMRATVPTAHAPASSPSTDVA